MIVGENGWSLFFMAVVGVFLVARGVAGLVAVSSHGKCPDAPTPGTRSRGGETRRLLESSRGMTKNESEAYEELLRKIMVGQPLDLGPDCNWARPLRVRPVREEMTMDGFSEFPKIARLTRPCVVTEKIDGTNAQVHVLDDGSVLAGSRSRYITPADDNFGFAAWVKAHEDELRTLGPGRHFGEWWGSGIQRGYGLKEKRFSLFNVSRWEAPSSRPECCGCVPVLYQGQFDTARVVSALDDLKTFGSAASPGFMKPEGVIVYHIAGNLYFKKTIEKDEEPKGRLSR